MEFTAKQIAEFVQGRVEGDPNAAVNSFAKIEEGKPGAISFLSNAKYMHYIYETKSTIVLINEDAELEKPVAPTLIRVKNAYESVARLLQLYESMKPRKTGIDPLAFVSSTATVGQDVYIGAFACIGDGAVVGDGCQIYPHVVIGDQVTLGQKCLLFPNVTIYQGCKLGNNVTIHAGSVIGADGFGFAPAQKGYEKIPQIGIVANTCIDRSTMGQTIIHRGVKLDNLIQVAHNCEIGENTVMSAQVGMAGSTKIGNWCMVGGQVGFAGHIALGDKTFVGAQSGVISNTKGNQTILGTPAMDPKKYFKAKAMYAKLPEMYKQIAAMQKEIDELKKK